MILRLRALIRKEFLQFFREHFVLILILWSFTGDIYLTAVTASYELEGMTLAVVDLDRSRQSRELIEKFRNTRYFQLTHFLDREAELDPLIITGQADLGLVIPPLFARQLGEGRPTQVQLLIDGTNPNLGLVALGYAQEIVERRSARVQWERMGVYPSGERRSPGVDVLVRSWFSPNLDSLPFMAVSEMCFDVMFVAMILSAAALVREREAGTLEQLLVTPARPGELILTKMLPMATINLLGLAFCIFMLTQWMGVPMRGSVILFFLLTIPFLFAGFGIGMLVSTLVHNLQQALLTIFLLTFPIGFLSGSFAPLEILPQALQYICYLSPLTYYNQIGFGIFFRGVGFSVLWPYVLALTIYGVLLFGFSVHRFRRVIA